PSSRASKEILSLRLNTADAALYRTLWQCVNSWRMCLSLQSPLNLDIPCPAEYHRRMKLSARNHLVGKVEELKLGDILAHVVVRVGDNLIDSVITRKSAEEMKLKVGDAVAAVIKSTEVMLQKD
ncbi:MAG TPA: molybdopterin-binding protein, partial [Candidatus Acidoferrales bacterium]